MSDAATLFDLVAPELADSADKQDAIDLAETQTGKVYGRAREHAVALLAAHILTVAKREGQSGAVSNLSEGNLSIGYGRVNPMGDTPLHVTSYGAELDRLRRSYVISARTVIV